MRSVLCMAGVCVILAVSGVAAQECTPQSIPYPQMGINFCNTHDLPWINLWHCMNPWHSQYNDGFEVGPDGWPIAGRTHNVRIGVDISMGGLEQPGVHKCSYKGTRDQILVSGGRPMQNGDGAFDGVWQNIQEDYPEPGYTYFEIFCADTPQSIGFTIDGHVEDFKILRPGFELDETRTIHPIFTDLMRDFTTFRFMPYLSSNTHWVTGTEYNCEGPSSIDWEDRTSPNIPQSFAGYKGGAWEWAVEICNELDKDMWINIPIIASDQYVDGLSNYLKQHLKPTLNVNIELGNETWNTAGGFCCFRQIQNYICGDDWGCHQRWPAKRLKTIVDIFAEDWGWNEINNRIRAILCGQIGYASNGHGWTIAAGLDYLEDSVGEGTARKYLYGVGAAPYFNSRGATEGVDAMLDSMESSIDNFIFGEFSSEYHSNSDQYMGNKLEGWFGEAGQYGLKLYSYEGGPDFDYTSGSGGDKNLAMQNPRMTDLVRKYYTKWYSWYGYDALFCHFGAWFNESGLYTLGESMFSTSTRQVAINEIVNNPAPPFDTTFRQVIPGDFFEIRKVSCYWSGWDRDTVLRYKRGEVSSPDWHPGDKWAFAVEKNGAYTMAVRHNCVRDSKIDVYMDGVKVYDKILWPNTTTAPGDWAFSTPTWTDSQGVTMQFDLSYGVHVMRFEYREDTDDNLFEMRWDLESESPPFQPAPVKGDINACLGNPAANYYVDIDRSVCEYEWDENAIALAGARLLPPTGGGGAVRTGQGTNTIHIDWSGVPVGAYTLRVRGANLVGASPWREFTVSVGTCGFTASPNPACINESITFTPSTPGTTTRWAWDFGAAAYPRTVIDSTGGPVTTTYTSWGSKAVTLTIEDQSGGTQTFVNTLIIGDTEAGAAAATPSTVSAGETSTITLSGYRGYVMRWQRSPDNVTWTDIASADLPYNTGPMAQSTWYRAAVQDGGCAEELSTPVQVVVSNPVQAGEVQGDTAVCAGQTPGVLALVDYGGTILRWEQATFPYTTWTSLAVTADTYTPGPLAESTQFRAVVEIVGSEFASVPATVTVTGAPVVGAISGPTEVCAPQSGQVYSVQPVVGATGYTWTVPSGATIVAGSGSASITVDFTTAASPGNVTAAVTSSCGLSNPSQLAVGVGGVVVADATYTDPVACTTTDGYITITLEDTPAAGTYEADLDNDGTFEHSSIPLVGATLTVSGFGNAETITNVRVQRMGSACPSPVFTTSHRFEASCAYTLAVPVPVPPGGEFDVDTATMRFAPNDQDSVRAIFYVVCGDSIGCALTQTNGQLYDPAVGIPLDLAGGRRVVVFQARPATPADSVYYSPSARDTAVFLFRPGFTVTHAWYYDTDADGHIDGARVVFDRDISQIPQAFALAEPPAGNPMSPTALQVPPIRESGTTFYADFTSQQFSALVTGFSAADLGRVADGTGFFVADPFAVGDSVAPVIRQASYHMAGSPEGGVYHDTLRVTFTEGVSLTGIEPISFSGFTGTPVLYAINVRGAEMTAIVQIPVDNRTMAPVAGDSVWIATGGTASITDANGVVQLNPGNRRAALSVVAPPDAFSVAAGPTRFDPTERVFTIVVSANERIGELGSDARGTMTVYDGLGNVVCDTRFVQTGTGLEVRWDGRNRSNRVVGQGTYLAVITVSAAGNESRRKIKIGVDRK